MQKIKKNLQTWGNFGKYRPKGNSKIPWQDLYSTLEMLRLGYVKQIKVSCSENNDQTLGLKMLKTPANWNFEQTSPQASPLKFNDSVRWLVYVKRKAPWKCTTVGNDLHHTMQAHHKSLKYTATHSCQAVGWLSLQSRFLCKQMEWSTGSAC